MQILTTLVQLHQQHPSPILKQWLRTNHSAKMVQLYNGIAKGKLCSDVQASLWLYEEANHPNYRRLKHLLKEKLLDLMFYMPVSDQKYNCTILKAARHAYIKAVLSQKVSAEQTMLEEVDLILA